MIETSQSNAWPNVTMIEIARNIIGFSEDMTNYAMKFSDNKMSRK